MKAEMGRIHLLDDDVINKIAAGEVVERPQSVVKELVENAVDARATQIEVALELGGVRSIAVFDNGVGMSAEDAHAALRRHATSKIRSADDLFQIASMGFRGEALASIASVSRFSLATVERGGDEGVKLSVQGGGPVEVLPWRGPAGTTVVAENLFFNMPVRAKFLKAPQTELSHCLELLQAMALCYPHLGFTLKHNGRDHWRVPAAAKADDKSWFGEQALRTRADAIFGKDAASLQYICETTRHGDLEALVSPPGLEKSSGKQLFLYVNGRWVKDKVLRYGVLRGYHTHLLKGRFPVAVVHLRLDPTLVDVNVHPSKAEVRFQYPDEVQNLVALAIRNKLRDATWASPPTETLASPPRKQTEWPDKPASEPSLERRLLPFVSEGFTGPVGGGRDSVTSMRSFGASRPGPAEADGTRQSLNPVATKAELEALLQAASQKGAAWGTTQGSLPQEGGLPNLLSGASRSGGASRFSGGEAEGDRVGISRGRPRDLSIETDFGAASLANFRASEGLPTFVAGGVIPWDDLVFLGALGRCYLLFEALEHLLIVDQHAFHERILFERLARDDSLLTQSQQLLVPEAVELSPSEVAVLRARKNHLTARGFDFVPEGETTILVRAVPTLLAGRDIAGLFADLGQDLTNEVQGEPTDTNAEMARLILAKAACHGAVRAGEELPPNELRQLLAEARTVDFYHNCPHGRRVLKWWTRSQVARWFDRT